MKYIYLAAWAMWVRVVWRRMIDTKMSEAWRTDFVTFGGSPGKWFIVITWFVG